MTPRVAWIMLQFILWCGNSSKMYVTFFGSTPQNRLLSFESIFGNSCHWVRAKLVWKMFYLIKHIKWSFLVIWFINYLCKSHKILLIFNADLLTFTLQTFIFGETTTEHLDTISPNIYDHIIWLPGLRFHQALLKNLVNLIPYLWTAPLNSCCRHLWYDSRCNLNYFALLKWKLIFDYFEVIIIYKAIPPKHFCVLQKYLDNWKLVDKCCLSFLWPY